MHWETKKVMTCFTAIFTLLQWSGTEIVIFLRHACTEIRQFLCKMKTWGFFPPFFFPFNIIGLRGQTEKDKE